MAFPRSVVEKFTHSDTGELKAQAQMGGQQQKQDPTALVREQQARFGRNLVELAQQQEREQLTQKVLKQVQLILKAVDSVKQVQASCEVAMRQLQAQRAALEAGEFGVKGTTIVFHDEALNKPVKATTLETTYEALALATSEWDRSLGDNSRGY